MMARRQIVIALTISISAIRIGMGYFLSVTGPNLLYLAHNVNVPVSTLSFVFSGGSFGIVLGAITGAVTKKRLKIRKLYLLGLASLVMGAATSATPLVKVYWVLFLSFFLGGILFGYIDAGIPALILDLWNEKESRFHIQLIHFMFSVGAFVAPFVAKVFTETNKEISGSSEQYCKLGRDENSTSPSDMNSNSTNRKSTHSFDGNAWTYYVLTIWLVPASVILLILGFLDVEGRMAQPEKIPSSQPQIARRDDPFREVVWLLIAIMGYYMCIVGMDTIMHNFLFSVVLCSGLNFTISQASIVNSLQWLGLGIGRLTGVFSAKYVKPRTVIIWSVIASTCFMVVMSIFGEKHAWVTWVGSFTHGLSGSVLFPTGISWISGVTNVSGSYMFIFALGSTIGSLTMMPLGGYVFDHDSFSVIYLVAASSGMAGVFFALSIFAARRFRINRDSPTKEKADEISDQKDVTTTVLLDEESAKIPGV